MIARRVRGTAQLRLSRMDQGHVSVGQVSRLWTGSVKRVHAELARGSMLVCAKQCGWCIHFVTVTARLAVGRWAHASARIRVRDPLHHGAAQNSRFRRASACAIAFTVGLQRTGGGVMDSTRAELDLATCSQTGLQTSNLVPASCGNAGLISTRTSTLVGMNQHGSDGRKRKSRVLCGRSIRKCVLSCEVTKVARPVQEVLWLIEPSVVSRERWKAWRYQTRWATRKHLLHSTLLILRPADFLRVSPLVQSSKVREVVQIQPTPPRGSCSLIDVPKIQLPASLVRRASSVQGVNCAPVFVVRTASRYCHVPPTCAQLLLHTVLR